MDYQKHYNLLIDKSISQCRKKYKKSDSKYVYYEKHHIIPECFFIKRKGIPSEKKGLPSGKKGSIRGPNKNPTTKLICPHCNKEGGISQMKRYHLDNCKVIV